MAEPDRATQDALLREASAWRDLAPPAYESTLYELLDELAARPADAERSAALLAVASAALLRNAPMLTESRAALAERLLALEIATSDLEQRARMRQLFLWAWQQLAATAQHGPESISVAAALPPGVALPAGADLQSITDPALRHQAIAAAEEHRHAADAWNAKQRALDHLARLSALLRARDAVNAADKEAVRELAAAMRDTPGLPPDLRRLLAEDASP